MKSLGWMMQKEIKKGILSSAPGGRAYAAFMPPNKRRKLERALKGKGKRTYTPMGKLARAIGYQWRETEGGVVVGWLSHSAVRLGTMQEKGFRRKITKKLRRAYMAAGIGLRPGKQEIIVPARPTIGPMRDVLAPKAAPYVEEKIWEYLGKGAPAFERSRRKYRVLG